MSGYPAEVPEDTSARLLACFTPAGRARLRIAQVERGGDEIPEITSSHAPLIVVPRDRSEADVGEPNLAIVGVEGADRKMAAELRKLLDPALIRITLVHATWLPETARSPLSPEGMANPQPIDLLLYRGAHDALIDNADALRDAEFAVQTRILERRNPADALIHESVQRNPTMFVLGIGKHGPGIGRELLRRLSVPILYVAAR